MGHYSGKVDDFGMDCHGLAVCTRKDRRVAILPGYTVVGGQAPVLGTRYTVVGGQAPVLGTRYTVVGGQAPVLGTRGCSL